MKKKVFRSITLVTTIVLLISLAVVIFALYGYFSTMEKSALKTQLSLAARGVETGGEAYLSGLETSGRVTLVSADGSVVYDSYVPAQSMENHAEREEIKEALASGAGESSRYSSTMSEKTLYMAQLLTSGAVLRMSITQKTVLALVLGVLPYVIIVFIAAMALSALLARRLSKQVVEPLNDIDLSKPLESDAYEELSPLLNRIEKQHRRIAKQIGELKRRQNEFAAVTENMNEGLVLLNEKGVILSINPAAKKIFGASGDCVGRDFLFVDRAPDVSSAIRSALSRGHSEVYIERAGRHFQLDVSRIGETQASGAVLLVFDITERTFSERIRREFTANVSHELKTPLQSIMGSAELMENGLVKPEDMPVFTSRIRNESARLVTLIEDIIRLSQLDEGGNMPREDIDIYSLSEEIAESLRASAAKKGVNITVTGERIAVNSVKRLVHEIIFNLCDNAVKYNSENGSVNIAVSENERGVCVAVSDTGIGIPPEHHERIFERFYRVDKSHSRSTGGTGLGLSIVKHAAQYLGAELSLESESGKGTKITVLFVQ